ncbi:MAG: tetratricopeptide repeat protein [Acidobacteriota bacterium]
MENPETDSIREGLKHLSDIVEGKITLQEVSGLSDEDVNAVLAIGALMYQQGRRSEAEDLFRGAVLLNKNNALAHSALGTVLTAEGKHDEALTALNEALRLNPDDISAYVNRAEIYLKRAEFKAASDDLKRAIELDPNQTDPGANRARAIIIGMSELIREIQKRLEQEQTV